uniref:Uncharacterized protein n=1 Tax=Sphenodon punctatus TaxID=8508 RepID=A0A8D0HC14_SPHPU
MVPTIYPLETLHNSLSLRQVNEFLTSVCRSCSDTQTRAPTALFDSMIGNQTSGDHFMPQRILSSSSSSSLPLRPRSDKPPWYSSGPSSTVSSAGPSSPTSAENCPCFSFTEKLCIGPQVSEETLNSQPSAQSQSEPSEKVALAEGWSRRATIDPELCVEQLSQQTLEQLQKERLSKEAVERGQRRQFGEVTEMEEEEVTAGGQRRQFGE